MDNIADQETQEEHDSNKLPQLIASAIQDICKDSTMLQSVTIAFNWEPALTYMFPVGVVVTSAGEINDLSSSEAVSMVEQWLALQPKLSHILLKATEKEKMDLIQASTTLKHVEALHDKARTIDNVTTPFREILRIASTEGSANAIANFEQWFCQPPEEKEEDPASGQAEANTGAGGRSNNPPPILQD